MFKYILGRIGAMLLTLFLVMTLSFWIIRLMPMSIFENPEVSPEIQKKLEDRMHLHEPMAVQYFYFIEGIAVRGDFGTSVKIRPGLDVFEILSTRIPATVVLNAFSLILSIPLGILFGSWAALKRNKWADNIISFWIVICISVPSFVFASLLQYFHGLRIIIQLIIRWIHDHDIQSRIDPGKRCLEVAVHRNGLLSRFAVIYIPKQYPEILPVQLGKPAFIRPSGKSFKPHGTASGKEVTYGSARYPLPYHAENSLSDLLSRRPDALRHLNVSVFIIS